MKGKIVAATAGMSLALCSAVVHADTIKPPDTGKLKVTDVYASVPQGQIFVESIDFTAPSFSQRLDWGKLLAFNILSLLGGAHSANSLNYDQAQQRGYAIHGLLDRYDGGSLLRVGTSEAIKSLAWLHPKDVQVTTDDSNPFLRASVDADSVLVLQVYYSLTPDFRAAVVAGKLRLYSRALSPPVDPYDPSSKSEWVRKPAVTREYIYQSKLLQLPDKTQAVIDQLSAEVDRAYDAAELKRQFDALPLDSQDVVDKRTMGITDKEKAYQKVLKDIKDPAWHEDDAALMYALMWSSDDGSLLKLAIQEGADSLSDLITRSIVPIPSDATPVAKDSDGKDAVFLVSKTTDRRTYVSTAGLVFSAYRDDTSHVEMAIPPWAD